MCYSREAQYFDLFHYYKIKYPFFFLYFIIFFLPKSNLYMIVFFLIMQLLQLKLKSYL